VAEPLAERRREQHELVELARAYVDALARRLPVRAAAVVGSVARGDFNVWSDVDVLVVADGLPARASDRSALLLADAPPRVQPAGFTREELARAARRGNPMVLEAVERGVPLRGEQELRRLSTLDRKPV
jgi:predicted nucleotidyltransferase